METFLYCSISSSAADRMRSVAPTTFSMRTHVGLTARTIRIIAGMQSRGSLEAIRLPLRL